MAILRTVWGYLVVVVATVICASASGLVSVFDRRGVVWWPISRFWAAIIIRAIGVLEVRTCGLETLNAHARHGVIVMSNHESHLDVATLIRISGQPLRFLTKHTLFWIPIFGWALWLVGHISINRSNREKAFASIERAARLIAGGRTVMIFPEGTRSRTADLGSFKKGGFVLAIKSGVPIVPVAVTGTREILAKGLHLLDRRGPVSVIVGEPIPTDGYELSDKESLMATVEERIRALRDEARVLNAGVR